MIKFSPLDITLLIAVSIMGTSISYLHHSRWKAVVLALPIPFTLVNLALGKPVGVYQVLGLSVLLLYSHAVRWLHVDAKMRILPAIGISVMGYCLISMALVKLVPDTEPVFWGALMATFMLATALFLLLPHRVEPGYRSPLPVPVKFLAIAAVITGLLYIKQYLLGFMSVFPMVGLIGAYEARRSLWAIGRMIPVLMLAMCPMLATIHLVQRHHGLYLGLATGWIVYLAFLIPLLRYMWQAEEQVEQELLATEG